MSACRRSLDRLATRERTIRLLATLVVALPGIFLLVSCRQQPAVPLRVGLTVWPPYELAFLAEKQDYVESGRIEFLDYEAPGDAARAFRNGSIDACALTLDYALSLRGRGIDFRIVLAIDVSNGADAIVAKPEIKSFEQLRNRRIGFERGPLGAYILSRALEKHGLTLDDIEAVPVDIPDQTEAFNHGKVDAVVTYSPTRTLLLKGGANQVFSSAAIPGEIVDVLLVREDVISRNPDAVREFVHAWFRSLEFFRKQPERAAALIAARERMTVAEFLDSFHLIDLQGIRENHRLLEGDDPELLKTLQRHHQVMSRYGLLSGSFEGSELITSEFLPPLASGPRRNE